MGKKTLKAEENDDIMEEMDASATGGKKGKKSKKKDDEDDITKELEEMSLEVNGEAPPKPKAVEEKNDKEEKETSKDKSKKEKKKCKNKRRGNDDDDDLDDLLAEIESEYRGEKPAKKESKDKAPEVDEDKADESDPTSRESSTKRDGKAQQKGKADSKDTGTNKGKKAEEKKDTKEKLPQTDSKKKDKKPAKEESPPVEDDSSKKKKKEKSKKEDKKKDDDDARARKGKPNKKMIEAMKLMLAKQKEEGERLRKEMEEKERQEQERIRQVEEQRRLEEERKERQKQKQKDRLKRLKDEGKLLTPKQKLEQKRVKAMLEHLKAQGVAIPEAGEKLKTERVSYKKQKRKKMDEVTETKPEEEKPVEETEEQEKEEVQEVEVEEEEEVADAWDQLSESEEEINEKEDNEDDQEEEGEVGKEADQDTENSEEGESENEERHTEAEKRKERALQRMTQRKLENEKNRSEDRLRAPVVCVLGHVDHGKTKILDKLRKTNVQEGEVGGITQQIGATNVPFDAIKAQTRMVKDFEVNSNRLPGLLIIDTPGHESFSNLRTRGSSLCDIAILVVDITQGLEPQTIESINLLKNKKTPFIVALNKIDRCFEWESHPSKDIREIIKLQNDPCKNDFERRTGEIIQALNMQGLNAALFWENPDPRSYVSLVPTSAISGDGMGNLMSLITSMCQKRLSSRLTFSEELQCTVLEVKTIQGHGTTIDVILVNGRLREGDTIILAGTEGPIVTQIRSLLIPKPMKEIRVKGQYDELKVVEAALGVKLAARELEKAIAGLNLQVANHEDEVEILKEEVDKEFNTAMRSIKVKDKGVYVQASTLGALEALLEFFKANKIPYAGIRVGPVVKRDVMKAAAMLEHDPMYAVILAFDVKVERDAQELADKEGIKIFSEETIYHLGDRYVDYIKEYKKKKQDEFRHVSVFPCRLKIIPDAIFNKRDPIVLGVTVDSGILRTGTPLCVPVKEFVEIGVVTSLEFDHKVVEIAKKGVNVCMKVEPVSGHTPKLFGRHFDADDILVSKITRESIDACKQYFRDDLGKNEWKLMAELKKQFNIL